MANNGFHVRDIESALAGREQFTTPKRSKIASRVARRVTRKVQAQAQAAVIAEVLEMFVQSVYETDSFGNYWNVTEYGRIEVAVPWSRKGSKQWNVRRTHAEVLRLAMIGQSSKRTPFSYDKMERRWYVDLESFPTYEIARQWLHSFHIDADMWNLLLDRWRRNRQNRH